MSSASSRKLSRRDAIKLLGAATGATLLANLPSKWSTPELASGVLPAHAQTSMLHTLTCTSLLNAGSVGAPTNFSLISVINITPAANAISMDYQISLNTTSGTASLQSSYPMPSASVGTGPGGQINLPFVVVTAPNISGTAAGTLTITWGFTNSAEGIGTCDQQFNWNYTT